MRAAVRSKLATSLVLAIVLASTGASAIAVARAPHDAIRIQRIVSRELPDGIVLAYVGTEGGVHRADGSACPKGALVVSYTEPGDSFVSGAFVRPLGSSDGGRTRNGVVLCEGSDHTFVGFTASVVDGRWDIAAIPDPEGEHSHTKPKPKALPAPPVVEEEEEVNRPDTAPVPTPANVPMTGKYDGPDIEGYARYEGQSTCDPAPKPGTVQLRNLLLAHYPVTTSFGIDRGCEVGGRSEHKEGRAFDWGANINNAGQKAAVQDFFETKLWRADKYGNAHAMARRMGVMYVIWNSRIWIAHSASWKAYEGTSPHTDHVHISLSWAGARAETSFWSGKVVEGLPAKPWSGDEWHEDDGDHWKHDDDDDGDWHGWKPSPSPLPSDPPVIVPTPTPTPTPAPSSTSAPHWTPNPDWTPPPWWH